MKATVINSSPNRRCGNTSLLLRPFMEGLRSENVDVKLFYTKSEEIHPCKGDYACWYHTPGACSIHDSMTKILRNMRQSEILVLATPIYAVGMTGELKTVIDRIMPLSKPHVEIHDGQCRLQLYDDVKIKSIVLVSSCGFWSDENFSALLSEVESFSKKVGAQFAGKLLRTTAEYFHHGISDGEYSDITDAAYRAALELVHTGAVSSETEAIISRPLMTLEESRDRFNEMADAYYHQLRQA